MTLTRGDAEELLYREALLLDRGAWDEWLALYCTDAVFWAPAWRDETTPTSDPDMELSLVYYQSRKNLEERVWRARSGLSVASAPRPRAVHAVTNVLVERANDAEPHVVASFSVHLYDVRNERTHVYFGRYEYRLRREGAAWMIAAKKIFLLNDVIPTVIDFYTL
ncbi:MAG TPA: aromatic-ring-hydroxylating dioxygenase subunit beta [Rhizomicrobium sp.]|nr:aromatic-ring-hydroxylating dioxygenase subunit beta [Rhizomicrobium sp.]